MHAVSEAYLEELGKRAVRYVRAGQTIGLGTGRAASAFIRAVGASGIAVRGVPTSKASGELGRSVGIEIVSLGDAGRLASDFDGADEVDPRLNLVKGYGGALVREKIVAASSQKFYVLVGEEKLVTKLGTRGSLPVEVVPFAVPLAFKKIAELGLKPHVRPSNGGDYITDNGNLIPDCGVNDIHNPARLDRELLAVPGVVGTGLFVGMTDTVLVATNNGGIRILRRKR
jgi:ribose 5-phosphate isomerase A